MAAIYAHGCKYKVNFVKMKQTKMCNQQEIMLAQCTWTKLCNYNIVLN